MTNSAALLLEIGTEELPAHNLQALAQALADNLLLELDKAAITHGQCQIFATPRRLAVLVAEVAVLQTDRIVEKRGPAVIAAFTKEGKPTPAAEGFARSCGVAVTELQQQETSQGTWLIFRQQQIGQPLAEMLPALLERVITQLPIPKPMRWGKENVKFSRPVHWLVLLHGNMVIPAEILGVKAGCETYGHRFMYPTAIALKNATDYADVLEKTGKVIADFAKRRDVIVKQTTQLAAAQHSVPVLNPALLDEVTGIVEWPVALLANFPERFLSVPHEALISAMQHHQKVFPVRDQQGHLLPHFITVSNIISKDSQQVIHGNERVMNARLADAAFFYDTDCKSRLDSHLEQLKQLAFQAKLGSMYEKSARISKLATLIYTKIKASPQITDMAQRAGLLCKADLVTNLVGEFPELQGIAGSYYAAHDGEAKEVVTALREYYLPRSANDELPQSALGCGLAIADRIDTIVGLFAIDQPPSGSKDPFGLRRAALAILKILLAQQVDISMSELLNWAIQEYQNIISNKQDELRKQCQAFIVERIYALYDDAVCAQDTLAAVLAVSADKIFDLDQRVRGLQQFRAASNIAELIANNKRIKNLLTQANCLNTDYDAASISKISSELLVDDSEKNLYKKLKKIDADLQGKLTAANADDYQKILNNLLLLSEPLHNLFEQVMIMVPGNQSLASNRLNLLAATRNLFLRVADISLLQV